MLSQTEAHCSLCEAFIFRKVCANRLHFEFLEHGSKQTADQTSDIIVKVLVISEESKSSPNSADNDETQIQINRDTLALERNQH